MDAGLNERVLRPSRLKLLGMCGLSILLAGGAVLGIVDGHPVVGWLGAVFFGVCIAVFVVLMLPGAAHLHLKPEGFETCSLFRRSYLRWDVVTSFDVGRIGLNKMVTFNFSEVGGSTRARAMSRAISGWEGALPDTYGMSPEDLASLMNACQRRAREAARQADATAEAR